MKTSAILMVSLCGMPACDGGDGDGGPTLQSACVADTLHLARTLPDGAACSNLGYGDCGAAALASECVGSCAFGVCQAAPCASDADCAPYAGRVCATCTIEAGGSAIDFGAWCEEPACPPGTAGCPCASGTCAGDLACGPDDRCHDPCPIGCRQGSVCCGGAFCGGDCIGTPCCG
jgi:hypothetical protein